MKRYARIQDGRVMELLTTEGEIKSLYHPSLCWLEVTEIDGLAVGWHYDNGHWMPPQPAAPASAPSLAELQHRVSLLSGQIAALLGTA